MTAGTKPELVVLMDIPNVKAHRARLLYAAGLRTAEAVAGSSVETLMSIIAKGELAACPGLGLSELAMASANATLLGADLSGIAGCLDLLHADLTYGLSCCILH